jgi:hypothetical protein
MKRFHFVSRAQSIAELVEETYGTLSAAQRTQAVGALRLANPILGELLSIPANIVVSIPALSGGAAAASSPEPQFAGVTNDLIEDMDEFADYLTQATERREKDLEAMHTALAASQTPARNDLRSSAIAALNSKRAGLSENAALAAELRSVIKNMKTLVPRDL